MKLERVMMIVVFGGMFLLMLVLTFLNWFI